MARLRFSGGIVVEGDVAAWTISDPGAEVEDSRTLAGEPVVVGPPKARRRDVDRARRRAKRLVSTGGALVAAAGVDLGMGLRTARLEGGDESRRDAVLAAAEVLGVDHLERLGERGAVLVALFGPRATKRVGQRAIDVLASGRCSALRLAVAVSDLLGPEALEQVLQFPAPADVEPVPRHGAMATLGEQLERLLTPFTPARRVALLRSLWDEVVQWQMSAAAKARARQRRTSNDRLDAWAQAVGQADDEWWRTQAAFQLGPHPTAADMLAWTAEQPTCWAAVARAFQQATAATTILRTALAAESQPVEAAVVAHLDQLAFAATAINQGQPNRIDGVRGFRPIGEPASDRAGVIASAAVLFAEPGLLARFVQVDGQRVDRRQLSAFLSSRLADAYELASAVFWSCVRQVVALQRRTFEYARTPLIDEWRNVAGYGVRRPETWAIRWLGPTQRPPLGARLHRDPTAMELLDDCLWLIDLADVLAQWHGNDTADVVPGNPAATLFGFVDEPDPRSPRLDSVPLAVAGVAQLLELGATAPPRPRSWLALADALVDQTEQLGFSQEFAVADEVLGSDRQPLPGADDGLAFEVARSAGQLAEWGNYMGNCIGSYAEDASRRFALVAVRDATGTLVANISIVREPEHWRVDQALGRYNEELPRDLQLRIRDWVDALPAPVGPAPAGRRRAGGGRGGRRGRPPGAQQRHVRVAAEVAEAVGDLGDGPAGLRPIAVELGWTGDDSDWLSPYVAIARPRRTGPLAAAIGRALASTTLAELWHATERRPLSAALAQLDPELGRLADNTVPPSLRPVMRDPAVWRARVVELAARRVRVALGELLLAGDARLDAAVVVAPHLGFLTAAVLAVTATERDRGMERVAVAADGTAPGRPRSSVGDPDGPWARAATRAAAVELGASADRIGHVLADAPGKFLLVPAAWVHPRGWTTLWARAHRCARETSKATA